MSRAALLLSDPEVMVAVGSKAVSVHQRGSGWARKAKPDPELAPRAAQERGARQCHTHAHGHLG